MNGPVSDDQDDLEAKEEPMDTSTADPGGKDTSKTEMELEEDSARPEGVVRFLVKDFSRLKETTLSDPVCIRNLPWRLMCIQRTATVHGHEKVKTLAVFLQCNPETDSLSWSCNATAQLVLVNQKSPEKSFKKKIQHLFFAKENDWGFSNFKEWNEILNTENGFLVDDTIIVEAHVVAEAPHGVAWDSKKHTGYVGLKNQGATCYMNSLLQTLFFTNKLRTAVYHMPTVHDDPQRSVAFNLQRVFYELQFSDKAVGTKKLTRSFGWETLDSFMQHDVQELCRVLLDNMESKMKGTCVEGVIPKLLEGKMCSYIKCTRVDYVSSRIESFYDIQLNVKGKKDIYESFKEYIAVETLDGDNKYDAGDYGMQEAKKGVNFHTFPTVLHLQLMRFQYDPTTDANIKINDRYEFFEKIDLSSFLDESRQTQATYTLHAVLVHSGDNHGGHYVVYINPKGDGKWCKFDDDVVSLASKQEAVDHNFGGYDDEISVKYCTNAYMLVYIKDSCLDDVLDTSTTEIPKELEDKLKEEKRLEAQRRKERSEAHLYMNVEVITEDQFCGHQGNDLFDPKKQSSKIFKILKEDAVDKMIEQLADALGYKPNQIRPWPFQTRKNNSYRISALDIENYSNKKVMDAVDSENECCLFIETTDSFNPNAKLPSFDVKVDILLFFKYYDPRSETMSYCGHAYVPMASKISSLLPMLCERAHLPKETPLMLFEEVRPGLTDHFKNLNSTIEDLEDIMDGDIICFQRKDIDLEEYKLRTCIDYFRDYHNRMEITMCDKNVPNDPGFNVTLSSKMTYTQMAEKVAWYLDVDPRKIQFFKAHLYGAGSAGNPLRCTYEGTLRDLMMYSQKTPKKLYYQLLSIPIDELENKKQVKCLWVSQDLKEQKELVLFPDKNGSVRDLLNEARKHVELTAEGSGQLRLLMVLSFKIQEILHEDSDLEIFSAYASSTRTYRVEEVPADEVSVGDDEELIAVAHFQKDTYQTFGTPFLLKIHDKEKFSNIMDRVKKKLGIPEKEFEKIKFARVRSGRQTYLQDEGDQQINIQDFRPLPSSVKLPNNALSRPWLGLDHVDKAPKKSRYNYLERSIKILN